MPTDLGNDPRFTELPQRWQDELQKIELTGMMGEDTWHEVVFLMEGMTVQCAVVNRRWVPLSLEEVKTFQKIVRVLPPIKD